MAAKGVAAVTHLFVLVRCEQIDRAHGIEPPLQPGNLALGFLPVDFLGRLGVFVDRLAVLPKRRRAALDFALSGVALHGGGCTGVIGMGELHLEGDIALLVVANLSVEVGDRLVIR